MAIVKKLGEDWYIATCPTQTKLKLRFDLKTSLRLDTVHIPEALQGKTVMIKFEVLPDE